MSSANHVQYIFIYMLKCYTVIIDIEYARHTRIKYNNVEYFKCAISWLWPQQNFITSYTNSNNKRYI